MAVTMFHQPSGRTQQASEGAYERVWRQEGWVLDEHPAAPASDETEPVDAETGDQLGALRAEAEELGIRVHPNAKAETIARKIAEAREQ